MGKGLRTTDAEIDTALERARLEPEPPTAVSARYHSSTDSIILVLKSGRRLIVPREEIQGLATARRSDVAEIEIENLGTALTWPRLDLDYSIEGLLKGITGNRRWMQELAWLRSQDKANKAVSTRGSGRVLVRA
jgi:hypothetical protein